MNRIKLCIIGCLIILSISLLCSSGYSKEEQPPILLVNPAFSQAFSASVNIVATGSGRDIWQGAGVVIRCQKDKPLLVLTVSHILSHIADMKMPTIIVHTYTQDIMSGMRVLKNSPELDLAILIGYGKEKKDCNQVQLATLEPMIGDHVFTIGSPNFVSFSLSTGVISQSVRRLKRMYYISDIQGYNGNSGGGLFNKDNSLIGIFSAIEHYSETHCNIKCKIYRPGSTLFIQLHTIKQFLGIK